MPRLPMSKAVTAYRKTPLNLELEAASIWSSDIPKYAHQLPHLWRALTRWEDHRNKSIDDLFEIIQEVCKTNPELRPGDTARLFAVRYAVFRMQLQWHIHKINHRRLSFFEGHQQIGTNYHIHCTEYGKPFYYYFKYGSEFDTDSVICTMSCIRKWYETSLFAGQLSFPTFRFVHLFTDFSHDLNEQEYESWKLRFPKTAQVMHAHEPRDDGQ